MTNEDWRKETDKRLKREWPDLSDSARDALKSVVSELSIGKRLAERYRTDLENELNAAYDNIGIKVFGPTDDLAEKALYILSIPSNMETFAEVFPLQGIMVYNGLGLRDYPGRKEAKIRDLGKLLALFEKKGYFCHEVVDHYLGSLGPMQYLDEAKKARDKTKCPF